MKTIGEAVRSYYEMLDASAREYLDEAAARIVEAKKRGGKVAVATGSGPNIHEGVTTLIAELMHKGIVDGVTTSSAVVAHEMGGVLDRVKRVDAGKLAGFVDAARMPRGNIFEFTEMTQEQLEALRGEMVLDEKLLERGRGAEGASVIKAAGNMAYPMGLRTEMLAHEAMSLARACGLPFEAVAGWGADERTMLGAGARLGLPVLVSVPQLVGGGAVGLCIADSIPISRRCALIARMLGEADVIIESAVALTQEIHDGPFETYTGHGIWADWMGYHTYSLKDKTLIRIDMDANLKAAWDLEKSGGVIQQAVDRGLPKTKLSGIPFRMEMSAFSRLETSLPVIGDIGVVWPVLARKVSSALGVELGFMSHPQQTEEGRAMRETIVNEVRPVDRSRMLSEARAHGWESYGPGRGER
jgi:hypothetical protein